MKFSFLFIILMVLLGGGAAALGDHVGRVVGKKRINFLKLRPKHTAIAFTFLFGMLATGLVIAVVALLVAPVRVWITEGEQARSDRDKARKELRQVEQQVAGVKNQVTESKKELDAKTIELAEANKQKEAQVTAAEDAKKQAEQAKSDADKAREDAQRARKDVEKVKGEIASTESRLKDTNSKLDEAKKALEAAQKEREAIANDNKAVNAENLKLTAQNAELDDRIKKLDANLKQLEATRDNLDKEKAVAEARLGETQGKLSEAESRLRNAEQAAKSAEAAAALAEYRTQALSGRPRFYSMAVRTRDELGRTVAAARANEETVKTRIQALLDDATRFLRSREERDAGQVFAKMIDVRNPDNSILTVDTQVAQVARMASQSPEPTLIIARNFVNVFQGEDAIVVLEAVPNRIVYVAGQTVFEGRVDGSLSRSQIIEQVTRLILQGLRSKVIADGVIPATGQDSELGEIPSDQVIDISDKLRQFGRSARLQFVSTAVTRRGDKLKLEYRLKP